MKGEFIIYKPEGILEIMELMRLHNFSRPLKVTVKQYQKGRTLSQNALYWMWVNKLSDWLKRKGRQYQKWQPEFVHEMLKNTLLGYESYEYVDMKTGEVSQRDRLKSTTDLEVGEMTQYMEQVYAWCAAKGLLLPIPEESQYADALAQMHI